MRAQAVRSHSRCAPNKSRARGPALQSILLYALSLATVGCGEDSPAANSDAAVVLDAAVTVVDATPIFDAPPPDAGADADLRLTLESTGLYSDIANKVVAADVQAYTPAYALWSDGAEKKRWVQFPEGSIIDTSDMDNWVVPVGTKMWKEFATPEGILLENRYMVKNGPNQSDWFYVAFAWNEEQTQAFELPGGDVNVLGTEFDIPSLRNCRKCHERQADFVIGFGAIQLAHQESGVNLDTLIAEGRLSDPPAGVSPYFTVPGNTNEQAVLGYLHGNCGGCHHPDSDVKDTTNLHLRLEVATLATVEETTIFTTIVGVDPLLSGPSGTTKLVEPGNLDASAIYARMNLRDGTGGQQMPPRGTERVDPDALTALSTWILSLE